MYFHVDKSLLFLKIKKSPKGLLLCDNCAIIPLNNVSSFEGFHIPEEPKYKDGSKHVHKGG